VRDERGVRAKGKGIEGKRIGRVKRDCTEGGEESESKRERERRGARTTGIESKGECESHDRGERREK
jgi:hypothetical protein